MMTRSKPETDQRKRFEQTARELGVELDEEKLKEALRRIAPQDVKSPSPKQAPQSDPKKL